MPTCPVEPRNRLKMLIFHFVSILEERLLFSWSWDPVRDLFTMHLIQDMAIAATTKKPTTLPITLIIISPYVNVSEPDALA